eukprot:CAMPEP_0172154528 /NCGR_PEP_ID=MMETSP1050-20130122/2088_1 /TAXON_ID=233186 /ORGANISM="Cryptomonas curvata, Strain CCAP979/52" /LENGTH=114 /DNA_ID=CAMNT_0012823261 /DNA_START=63 /DNA_END=407 /DNA_ORIENTATION=+
MPFGWKESWGKVGGVDSLAEWRLEEPPVEWGRNVRLTYAVSCRRQTKPRDVAPTTQGRPPQIPLELDALFDMLAACRGGHGRSSWRCLLREARRSGSAHQASDGVLSIPQQAPM